jgi:toxin CcdB
MAQFDVYPNPVTAARRAYPWVVAMQCDLLSSSRARVVAPLVLRDALRKTPGRLTPAARFDAADYLVLVPALASLPAGDLTTPAGSIATHREALLAAVDHLFFGI